MENNEQQNTENPPQPTPTPPAPTPDPQPAPANQTGAIDNRTLQMLEATMQEQRTEIARLREENTRNAQQLQTARPAAPVRTEEELRTDFFNKPHEETEKIINKALQESVLPLIRELKDFTSGIRATTVVDKLVAGVKRDSRFSAQVTPDIEAALTDALSKLPPDQLNDNTAIGTLIHVIGLKAIGVLPNTQPAQSPTPTPPVNNTPAHLRPSPAPAPNGAPNKQEIKLTENERRLAREQKMTDHEFVFWRDMPPEKVSTAVYEAPK